MQPEAKGAGSARGTDRLDLVLAGLETKTLGELQAFWLDLGEPEPVPALGAALLRRLIAYRLQEKRYGGLSSSTLRELERFAKGKAASRHVAKVHPGTTLIREWNGQTISVQVRDDGYLWQDQLYSSLSAIARSVTGAQWSGPRFFGLTRHG